MLLNETIVYADLTSLDIKSLRLVPNRDRGTVFRAHFALLLDLIIGLVLLPFSVFGAPQSGEVSGFHQFYSLSRDQALQNLPVKIRGIVLCFDAGWNQLYIYDGKETTWISPVNFQTEFRVGQYVEITGTTTFAQGYPAWTNLSVLVLGQRPLPIPKGLTLPQLCTSFGQWIETSGQVRAAEASRGRLALMVHDQGIDCLVYVMGLPVTNADRSLVGARIRFPGINSSKATLSHLDFASVFVSSFADIKVIEPASPDFLDSPVMAIDALLDRALGPWTNRPVHINGLLAAYKPGQYISVKDPTGVIRARVSQITRASLDERVNVWGFLTISPNEAFLADASFELTRPGPSESALRSMSPQTSDSTNVLTAISQVLKLDGAGAARAYPVRLCGTMTFADPQWQSGFLQDATGAIFFDLNQREVHPGQWVELTGRTDPGGYAPQIVNSSVRILHATNAPPATKVDLDDLHNGDLDSHWVQMEGVVRRVTEEWGHTSLALMSPKGSFRALIPGSAGTSLSTNLIDALVSIRGVCSSDVNERGQLTGFTLHVPGFNQLTVLKSSPADPFTMRTTPSRAVARFDPDTPSGRRVKVRGVVTLTLPGQGFFLQDGVGGIRVHTFQTNEVQLGDLLEVLGFPAIGDFSPRLDEAVFRLHGSGPVPAAKVTTAEQILVQGANDSVRVCLEAQLLESVTRSAHPKLVLQSGPIIFTARLVGQSATSELFGLRPGSLLRVTGVCSVQGGERHQAEAFRLLIARPCDVWFLSAPPLWTGRNFLILAGAMALVILSGLGWVLALRRHVRRQTAAVHKEKSLLATLIDHLPDNVYVKDLEGRYVLTNGAHSRFHGAPSPGYFRGKSASDLFPPERAKAYAEADAKVLSGAVEVFTCEEIAVDGQGTPRRLATTKVPLRDPSGKIMGLVGFSRDITEAKRAELELKEKERALSTLMSNLPGLAYRCRNDRTWTMEFLSEGCLELTGFAPADLLRNARTSYLEIIHPDDRERVWDEVQFALRERRKFQLLYRIVTRNGSEKWVWEHGLGIFSADGELQALEGFVTDITERRRADEALRVSEERFRAIWEHSIDGLCLTNPEGRILAVNEAFCCLVKLTREQLEGQLFSVAYRGQTQSGSLETYLEQFRAGKVVARTTARAQFSNGEEKDLEFSSCFVDLGQQGRTVLSILRDISERRRVESVLAYERDLLTALFDNLPDALYFKDLHSRFVRVSKSKLESSWAMALARHRFLSADSSAAAKLPHPGGESAPEGIPPAHLASREGFAEYILGKTDFDFFDEARARGAFEDEQEIIRTGLPLIGKLERTNHLDGRVSWSLSTKMPWRDKDGRLIGTFGVSKDITGIKEAEASLELVHKQLVEASRQAGMAEVATGVLHNVGNVLNSVNVSATLLSERLQQSKASSVAKVSALMREHSSDLPGFIANDPRGKQLPLYLEQLAERLGAEQASLLSEVGCLAKNVEHIKNIVAMQQTYAKPAGVTESVPPADLVEDALRINNGELTRRNVQVVREYEPHLPNLSIDKHKVLQILVNLVSNAGHACEQASRPDKRLTVRLTNGGDRIKISLSDNGVGIAPENLTRIFSLGFTTRPGGHGFGLHSGALAARQIGGTLVSHSDGPGCGATFVLELPLSSHPS